jgi:WD40 repeat protein
LHTLKGHTGAAYGIAFAPDGQRVATAGEDRAVRLWDAGSGKEIKALTGHGQRVMRVAFSPDGKWLVSGNEEEWKLWDAGGLAEVRTVTGPAGWFAFAPDGKSLLVGRHNNAGNADAPHTITRWDTEGKDLATLTLQGRGGWANYALSPDGKTLFAVAVHVADRTLRSYDTATGAERPRQGHAGQVLGVAISPDGKTLASCGEDRTVRPWDLATARLRHTLAGNPQQAFTIAFSPDGKALAAGRDDGTIPLWDAATGKELRTLTGHEGRVWQIAFSPDGRFLASAGQDGIVKLWEVQTGRTRRSFRGRLVPPMSVAFSPDGKTLACGAEGGRIALWDVDTGWELGALRLEHEAQVRCVAFHPGGQLMASSSHPEDGSIRLWDLDTLREKSRLEGHAKAVLSCAWRADGGLLASAGWVDGSVRLWDMTGSPPRPKVLPIISSDLARLHDIALSPEGRYLATANPDGSVYLLRLARPGEVFGVPADPR